MKRHRVWIEIIVLGVAIAFALALLIASLGAAAAAVDRLSTVQTSPGMAERTYEGMVTCSRCGAKHSASMGYSAEVCVRICVRGGAGFTLVSPDATYLLDGDQAELKKLAGRRAVVVGSLSGNTIRIASVVAET